MVGEGLGGVAEYGKAASGERRFEERSGEGVTNPDARAWSKRMRIRE
jgi:hypothetical protein